MKKHLIKPLLAITLLFIFLFAFTANGQTVIYTLDFETPGGYTTSIPEVIDESTDYFGRIEYGVDSPNPSFTNLQGDFYFGAQDIDGISSAPSLPVFLNISAVDITGYTHLELRVYLAEDDDGTNQDWDATDYVHFKSDIDHTGSFTDILNIESSGGTNTEPAIDTNFDGTGNGTAITNVFTQFSAQITGTGSNLDIQIELNLNSGDEDIAIDHIEIIGRPLNPNDNTTEVYSPATQIPASTQTAASVTTSATSFAVLAFIIEDQASGDALPTEVTYMRFVPGANNTADWTDHIQGITIVDENSTAYSPTVSISDTEIILDFATSISIADGTKLKFEITTYLNETNLLDNSVLQFQIDAASSGFWSEVSGSGFADPFANDAIVGNNHSIEVHAIQLSFIQQPTDVIIDHAIDPSPRVAAYDANSNLDLDFTNEVSLTLPAGVSFDASATSTVTAVNGIATFSNLIFNSTATEVTLSTSNATLSNDTSASFSVIVEPIVIAQEDFDGNAPTWPNDIAEQTFVDPTSPNEGLFIQPSTYIGSGNTAFARDAEGESGEPTLGNPYVFTFDAVAVSNFSNVTFSFDYYVFANVDTGSYQLFIDGTPQAAVEFYNDPDTTPVQGTISVDIGSASTIGLILTGTLNGGSDVIELDNFVIQGNYDGDLIYVSNAWTPSAPSASSASDDVLIQDGTYTTSSDLSLNSITVLEGASVEVNPSDVLSINSAIHNNGRFIFKSNALSTAQLADATGSTINGDISVERFISAKRAFRLLSSAVGGQSIANTWQQNTHITGTDGAANGFDPTETNNPSMFIFDNTLVDQSNQSAWSSVSSTSEIISAGTPYRLYVRGDRSIDLTNDNAAPTITTLKATGSMQTGSFTTGNQLAALANDPGNFSFVGNPYQAVVDYSATTRSNLTDFIYVWDTSVAGSNGNGGYITVEISSNTITAPSPSSSDASKFIAPGQAFFVQNTAAGNGSITFEEADKATSQAQVSVFNTYSNFFINSRLFKTDDLQNAYMESDAIGLRFSEDYTTLGSDEDAIKLANPGENYAIVNEGFRSIDKQGLPENGHEISLILVNYQASNYSLTFELENKPEDLAVYLNDRYLNTKTELSNGSTYEFTVDESISESSDSSRFNLSFEQESLSDTSFTHMEVRLYPNPVTNRLTIELPATIELESVKLYTVLGQEKKSAQSSPVDLSDLESGVYLVKVNTNQGQLTKKIIKQ